MLTTRCAALLHGVDRRVLPEQGHQVVDDRDQNRDHRAAINCDNVEEAALWHQKPALLSDGVTARV